MDFIVSAIKARFLIIIEVLRNGIHREFVTHAQNRWTSGGISTHIHRRNSFIPIQLTSYYHHQWGAWRCYTFSSARAWNSLDPEWCIKIQTQTYHRETQLLTVAGAAAVLRGWADTRMGSSGNGLGASRKTLWAPRSQALSPLFVNRDQGIIRQPPIASSFLLTKAAHAPLSLQGRAAMSPLEHPLGSLMDFLLLSRLISECRLCPDGWCLWSALSVRTGPEAGLLAPQAEPTAQPSEIWQSQCHLVHEPDQPSYMWTM